MLKLKEIIEDLMCDDETSTLLENCTLISAVGFYGDKENLEKWELIFYDLLNDKAYKIDVDHELNYRIYESELLDKRFKDILFDVSSDFIDEDEALRVSFDHYMSHYRNKEIESMFIVLNTLDNLWHLNLLTRYLSVIQISVDLYSGEVKDSKEVNLIHVERE